MYFFLVYNSYKQNTNIGYYVGWWRSSGNIIRKTVDGGGTWTTETYSGIEDIIDEYPITDVVVVPWDNGFKAYISFADFVDGKRVFEKSYNSSRWTTADYFDGIGDNLPVNCLEYDEVSKTLYARTDRGVYSKAYGSPSFQDFGDLPQVLVTDIQTNQTTRELYISTYGRGVWKTDLDKDVDISPLIIDGDYFDLTTDPDTVGWSSNFTFYRDVIIKNGAILRIHGNITSGNNGTITVEDGSALIIEDGGTLNLNNDSLIVEENDTFQMSAGATLNLENSAKIIVETDGYICIDNTATVNLEDCASSIDLYADYNSGRNYPIWTVPTCDAMNTLVPTGDGFIFGEEPNSPLRISGTVTGATFQRDIVHAGDNLGSTSPVNMTSGVVNINGGLEVVLDQNVTIDGSHVTISIIHTGCP